VPNLFSVPGDPVAGFLLASGGVLAWKAAEAAAVSLLLYAAGLLLNDYFDRKVDARERPERPIPSGGVSEVLVIWVGFDLLIAGVALGILRGGWQAAVAAPALALAMVAYNVGLKKLPWVGPIAMGSCRAGSVLVGAAFAGNVAAAPVLVAAAVMWVYIGVVTHLAVGEARRKRLGASAFVPALVLAGGGCAMAPFLATGSRAWWFALAVLGVAVAAALAAALDVRGGRKPVPAFIGELIRATIPAQGAWCLWRMPKAAPGGAIALVAACFALAVGARLAARRFYGS